MPHCITSKSEGSATVGFLFRSVVTVNERLISAQLVATVTVTVYEVSFVTGKHTESPRMKAGALADTNAKLGLNKIGRQTVSGSQLNNS